MKSFHWSKNRYRRMLVDMHIPDWDPAFLSQYNPARMIEIYKRAGVNSVMFYCQSHVGLCYWPTKTGKQHAGLKGQDIVGEMLNLLRDNDISAIAYYSLIFNNQVVLDHPDWSIKLPGGQKSIGRYGVACLNQSEYQAFAREQTQELVSKYDFDGLFFDMTFWPAVCTCDSCRSKFHTEEALDIPQTVDWLDPNWCRFQTARERWVEDFTVKMTSAARQQNPHLPVYHNFATALGGWGMGVPFSAARHHTFLGADFYGDRTEQFLACKAMLNLSEETPIEFMTSRCVTVFDHVTMKPVEELEIQAFASTLFSAASLFIDAINPDGTISAEPVERIAKIFERTAEYEPYLGGKAVEDIGVYFSDSSRMDFSQNGTPVDSLPGWYGGQGDHTKSIRAFCRVLQEAHLPFGIISKRQISKLDDYKIIILPNVSRMDPNEVDAFRSYVKNGGKLYADTLTSLTETQGIRHRDFMLGDVFGCSFDSIQKGVTYLKPQSPDLSKAIFPQGYINQHLETTIVLKPNCPGQILATLNLPFASPDNGTTHEQKWASIHTAPPWTDTGHPMIVSNLFGQGRCIYSATPIENIECEANQKLLLTLLRSLLESPTYTVDTHPHIWVNIMHQPEKSRYLIGLLNAPDHTPPLPVPDTLITLRPPTRSQFTELLRLPSQTPIPFGLSESGQLQASLGSINLFELFIASYQKQTE